MTLYGLYHRGHWLRSGGEVYTTSSRTRAEEAQAVAGGPWKVRPLTRAERRRLPYRRPGR